MCVICVLFPMVKVHNGFAAVALILACNSCNKRNMVSRCVLVRITVCLALLISSIRVIRGPLSLHLSAHISLKVIQHLHQHPIIRIPNLQIPSL